MAVKVQLEIEWEDQLIAFQSCQVASIINNHSMLKVIRSISNHKNLYKLMDHQKSII